MCVVKGENRELRGTTLFAYHKHFDICFMIQIERNDVSHSKRFLSIYCNNQQHVENEHIRCQSQQQQTPLFSENFYVYYECVLVEWVNCKQRICTNLTPSSMNEGVDSLSDFYKYLFHRNSPNIIIFIDARLCHISYYYRVL